jgi:hypothetical protein
MDDKFECNVRASHKMTSTFTMKTIQSPEICNGLGRQMLMDTSNSKFFSTDISYACHVIYYHMEEITEWSWKAESRDVHSCMTIGLCLQI